MKKQVIIEFDGYHGNEMYVLPYPEAMALIPILLNHYPTITVSDYDHRQIHRYSDTCDRCPNYAGNEPNNAATTF